MYLSSCPPAWWYISLLGHECPDVILDVGQPPSITFHILSISTAAIILELWPFSFFYGWRQVWLNKHERMFSVSYLFLYRHIMKVKKLPPQGCVGSYGVRGVVLWTPKNDGIEISFVFSIFHSICRNICIKYDCLCPIFVLRTSGTCTQISIIGLCWSVFY